MTKSCPFMSYRGAEYEEIFCIGEECALYDDENCQCCFKTQALAAAAKPPVTPVMFQPGVCISPAAVPNGTGDWVDPNPYRIDCSLDKEVF